jgi:hypothetical protein
MPIGTSQASVRTLKKLDTVKAVIVDLDDTLWRGVLAEREYARLGPFEKDLSREVPMSLEQNATDLISLSCRRFGVLLAVFLFNTPTPAQHSFAQSKLVSAPTQTFNIRDFGAKCDGKSDDYAAISGALDRAGNTPGAEVYFPISSKACTISKVLKAPANVTLRAEPGTVIIQSDTGNTSNPVLLSLSSGVKISGISFDGGGGNGPNTAALIVGYKVSNVTIDRVSVKHSRGVGLVFSTNVTDTVVQHSIFADLGNHWKVTHNPKDRIQGVVFCCGSGNSHNAAIDNDFSDIGLDALQFSEQTNATITGNRFHLENGERRVVSAPDFPAGIFAMHIDGATITENLIMGAQGNCIDAPALINARIVHNEINGCGAVGIGLFDGKSYGEGAHVPSRVSVLDNKISNVGTWASATPARRVPIFVEDDATEIVMTNSAVP